MDRMGHFWLPATPHNRVPGAMMYDGSEVVLTLLGRISGDFADPTAPREPDFTALGAVHGDLINSYEQVTLLAAHTWFDPFNDHMQVRSNLVVLGAHTDRDEPIARVRFEMDGLIDLLPADPIKVASRAVDGGQRMSIESVPIEPVVVTLPFGTLRISCATTLSRSYGATLSPTATAEVDLDPPLPLRSLVSDVVSPLRSLLSLLHGVRPAVTRMEMQAVTDDVDPLRDQVDFARTMICNGWAAGSTRDDEHQEPRALALHNVFHNRDDRHGNATTVLAAWWSWYTANIEVAEAANRTAFRDQRTAHEFFADYFSACDIYGDRYRPDAAQHSDRVAKAMDAIPADHPERDWIHQVLRAKDSIGLTAKLKKLAEETAGVPDIFGPGFVREIVKTRSTNAHGGARRLNYPEAARRLRAALLLRFASDEQLDPATFQLFADWMTRMTNHEGAVT